RSSPRHEHGGVFASRTQAAHFIFLKAERLRQKLRCIEAIAAANNHARSAREIITQLPAALCYSEDRIRRTLAFVTLSPNRLAVASLITFPARKMEALIAKHEARTRA